MTTTALLIEHLIGGVQALAWFALLVFTLFGFHWIDINKLKGTEAFVLPLLLAMAYPFGVFIDNLADDIFKSVEKRVTSSVLKAEGLSGKRFTVMQLMDSENREFAREYLGYVRTRVRLSRSTALNFLLITFSSVAFTIHRLQPMLGGSIWVIVTYEAVIGLVVILLAIRSWFRSSQTFSKQLIRAYKLKLDSDEVLEANKIIIAKE